MHPDKIGRYEVLAQIGKGAMGVVYKARDPRIDRVVVLKTLRRDIGADEDEIKTFVERFYREARAAGKLSHPAIVTIHDVDRDEEADLDFIAMEYVPGASLQEILKRGERLDEKQVVAIASQVASGLDYAHAREVVHRDIKPANIILREDGQAKITDFGIARMQESDLTRTGECIGTPNYMSPEQVLGDPVDGRADQFALAIVLYQLLTGKRPFKGGSLTAITYRIVHQMPKPPIKIASEVSKKVSDALMRGLAKDPDDRFPTCTALVDEVADGLSVDEDAPPVAVANAVIDAKEDSGKLPSTPLALDTYSETMVTPKRDRSTRPKDPQPEEPGSTLSLADEINELDPELKQESAVAGPSESVGRNPTEDARDEMAADPGIEAASPPANGTEEVVEEMSSSAPESVDRPASDQLRVESPVGDEEIPEEDLSATLDLEEPAGQREPEAVASPAPGEPPKSFEVARAEGRPHLAAQPQEASAEAAPEATHPGRPEVRPTDRFQDLSGLPSPPPDGAARRGEPTRKVPGIAKDSKEEAGGPGAGFWIVGVLLAMLFVAFLALFLGLLGKASSPTERTGQPVAMTATIPPAEPSPTLEAPAIPDESPSGSEFSGSDETILLQEGVRAYREGRLDDAREFLSEAVRQNPESGAADLLDLVEKAMAERAAAAEEEQAIPPETLPASDGAEEPGSEPAEANPVAHPTAKEAPDLLPLPTPKGTASLVFTFRSVLARATIEISVDGSPYFSTSYVSSIKNKVLRHVLPSEKRFVVKVPEGEHSIEFHVVSKEEGVETAGTRSYLFRSGRACDITLAVGRMDKEIEISRHCR